MKDYLKELNNNESILLMYLAGELAEQERLEVEQLLTSDAGLRAELESLRAAHHGFLASMEALDAAESPAVSESLARRQVSRLIRRWTQERFEASAPPVMTPPTPIAWRQISFAAAAALLIGVYVWAVYHPIVVPGAGRDAPIIANGPHVEKNSPGTSRDAPILVSTPPVEKTSPANSDETKLAMLSSSLEDAASASEESSNVHLAAFAALEPGASTEGDLSIDAVRGSDRRNETSEP